MKSTSLTPTGAPSESNELQEYQEANIRLKSLLKATGRIYLNSAPAEQRFGRLPAERQQSAIKDIIAWCDVVQDFMASGGHPAKTQDLARYYFSRLGILVDSAFVMAIKDGDIVEIFDRDCRRIFFNPELFDYSSYSPDEMFSSPFWDLYRREDKVSGQVAEVALGLVSGKQRSPVKPNIDKHTVSEMYSERKYSCEVEIPLCAPMFLGDTVAGFVALEKFRLLLS